MLNYNHTTDALGDTMWQMTRVIECISLQFSIHYNFFAILEFSHIHRLSI